MASCCLLPVWNNTISRPLNPYPCSTSSFFSNPRSNSSSRFPVKVKIKAQQANNEHQSFTSSGFGFNNNNKACGTSEQKWVAKGLITESLTNGMFRVRLENGYVVLGYISGKIRRNFIRMLPDDKVKIEVSKYDSTRGCIVYRIGNKD